MEFIRLKCILILSLLIANFAYTQDDLDSAPSVGDIIANVLSGDNAFKSYNHISQNEKSVCVNGEETYLETYTDKNLFYESWSINCTVINSSHLCQSVKSEDKHDCSRPAKISWYSHLWEKTKSCGAGFKKSWEDWIHFIKQIGKYIVNKEDASNVGYRDKTNEKISEVFSAVSNYMTLEMTKYQDKYHVSKSRAFIAVTSKVFQKFAQGLQKLILKAAPKVGCYNYKAKTRAICQVVAEFFAEPFLVFKFIKLGPKVLKGTKLAKFFRFHSGKRLKVSKTQSFKVGEVQKIDLKLTPSQSTQLQNALEKLSLEQRKRLQTLSLSTNPVDLKKIDTFQKVINNIDSAGKLNPIILKSKVESILLLNKKVLKRNFKVPNLEKFPKLEGQFIQIQKRSSKAEFDNFIGKFNNLLSNSQKDQALKSLSEINDIETLSKVVNRVGNIQDQYPAELHNKKFQELFQVVGSGDSKKIKKAIQFEYNYKVKPSSKSQVSAPTKEEINYLKTLNRNPKKSFGVRSEGRRGDIHKKLVDDKGVYKEVYFKYLDEAVDENGVLKLDWESLGAKTQKDIVEIIYTVEPITHRVRITARTKNTAINHASLAGSRTGQHIDNVRANSAGLIRIDENYKIIGIGNESGHFRPSGYYLEDYTKEVFRLNGVEVKSWRNQADYY